MNGRREPGSRCAVCLVVSLCAAGAMAAAMLSGADPAALASLGRAEEARRVLPLDAGWRFQLGDAAGARAPAFDDSAWAAVSLPHCFVERGPAWYRLRLKLPAAFAGKAVYLEFGAVSQECEVFLDGEPVGTHRGAYAAFRLPLTGHVAAERDHLLAVRVQNGLSEVVPLGGGWGVYGGIYRPARLIAAGTVSLDLLDHGGPGVYLKTQQLDPDAALVNAKVRVRNVSNKPETASVAVRVLDAVERAVAEGRAEVSVAAAGTGDADLPLRIERPRPWAGRADPFMYTAEVEVRCGDAVTDQVRESFGVCHAAIDPERGFLLNGKPYDLRGVAIHQEIGDRGWAATAADIDADLAVATELGCTGVRLVHYPHSLYTHRQCDRLGLVAWAEVPIYNHIYEEASYAAGAKQQMIEMIRQTYNSPSVCIWAVSNEIRLGRGPNPAPLLRELIRMAKAEDPKRIVTLAAKSGDPAEPGLDAVAINCYFGWYSGSPEQFGPASVGFRHRYRPLPVGISEYGAGCNPALQSLTPRTRDHTEQWQCIVHEHHWKAMAERPWLWCKFIWLGFDFSFPGLKEPGMPNVNNKGLVTRDRKIKKDAFYWYKAHWSDEPFVYITSRRFTPRTEEKTPVKVYSNCPDVELIVSGQSAGVRRAADRLCVWPEVTLRPGDNVIEAVGRKDAQRVRDRCAWTIEKPASPSPR
jgi:beta-galactosidase